MYDSIEYIKQFVKLHAILLLYKDDIDSCKNTIELFVAADVKVIVVRSQTDTLDPASLREIEPVEKQRAEEYGAMNWTTATTKIELLTNLSEKLGIFTLEISFFGSVQDSVQSMRGFSAALCFGSRV